GGAGSMTGGFSAPLSARVKATSALGTVVLVGEFVLMLTLVAVVPEKIAWLLETVAAGIVGLLGVLALTAVRGYRFAGDRLLVARAVWATSYSLAGLRSAARDPRALRFTLAGFGNNGFFALNGWRRVEPYGWCRVLATDPEHAVVLCTPERTLIVTPDRP